MKFESYLQKRQERINSVLPHLLPSQDELPFNLHQAMHYAVMNGGKRLRPILVYAVGETFGASLEQLDATAAAIEFIHSASLVHDDLPAMDNDTLRRGKPTCHIAFDEATAILVGDALILHAFVVISNDHNLSLSVRAKLVATLATASGSRGMCGGQDIDIMALQKPLSVAESEIMYKLKTGALLRASVALGAIAARVINKKTLMLLDKFADALGFAFQIQDDILDIESNAAKLGKNTQQDKTKGKVTYPELIGIENAKAQVKELWQTAQESLVVINSDTHLLQKLAEYIMRREY